jgi:hypothetical protein
MKHEYREGPEARNRFEEGMTKLFKAPKAREIGLNHVTDVAV